MIVYSLKLLLCVFGVVLGTMLGGMLSAGLGLQRPQKAPGLDMRLLGLWTTVAGLGMSIGQAEIARRITGGKWVRWFTLAWFTYTCMGSACFLPPDQHWYGNRPNRFDDRRSRSGSSRDPSWFLLGGVLCIFMAVAGLFIPAVMNIEMKDDPMPEVVDTGVRQAV